VLPNVRSKFTKNQKVLLKLESHEFLK
jgi:hypothetical protein